MTGKVYLKVEVPQKLALEVEQLLLTKGLSLDDTVRLYLRAMVTSSERNKALGLDSEMPFGKYKGELIEVVLRAEPNYVSSLVSNGKSIKFQPEVLELLKEIQSKLRNCINGY